MAGFGRSLERTPAAEYVAAMFGPRPNSEYTNPVKLVLRRRSSFDSNKIRAFSPAAGADRPWLCLPDTPGNASADNRGAGARMPNDATARFLGTPLSESAPAAPVRRQINDQP